MIKPIDKTKIDNRKILDAVMEQLIPRFNEVVDQVNKCPCKAAKSLVDESGGLPEDIPHRDLLLKAGFSSVDDVKEANLTATKGLGPKRAKQINEWLD